MNEVTPELWVKEMESGKWECATGTLTAEINARDPETGDILDHVMQGHCCIGVLGSLIGYTDEQMEPYCDWIGWEISVGDEGRPTWHLETATDRPLMPPPPPPEWLTAELARQFIVANDDTGKFPIDEIKKVYGLS